MKKRIFSLAVCLSMMLTWLPTAGAAAGTPATSVQLTVEAQVYNESFTTPDKTLDSAVVVTLNEGQYLADPIKYGETGYTNTDVMQNYYPTAQNTRPASGGYAYFSNGVLTLHNFSITTRGIMASPTAAFASLKSVDTTVFDEYSKNEQAVYAAIFADGDLTIALEGTNTAAVKANGVRVNSISAGVAVDGDLTIRGAGTLTAQGSYNSESSYVTAASCGIFTTGSFTLASTDTQVVAKGDGTDNGIAPNRVVCSYGVYAEETVSISAGTLTASGNPITIKDRRSCGIVGKLVNISGGTVTATGGTGGMIMSFGIQGVDGVTLSGGVITATGGQIGDQASYGVYSDFGTVTIGNEDTNVTVELTLLAQPGSGLTPFAVCANELVMQETDCQIAGGSIPEEDRVDDYLQQTARGVAVTIECNMGDKFTWDPCNGETAGRMAVTGFSALTPPTWEGYTFAGWYTAPNGEGTRVTTAPEANATVYAKWTQGAEGKTVRTQGLSFRGTDSTLGDRDCLTTQGWKWEQGDGKYILTLDGALIDTTDQNAISVDAPAPVEIVLADGSENTAISRYSGILESNGISLAATTCTISGAGALTVTGGNASSANSNGLLSTVPVALTGGATLTATGGRGNNSCGVSADISVANATLVATGGQSGNTCGVSGTVTVSTGGRVTATGGGAGGGGSYGVYGAIQISDDGVLTATGGDTGSLAQTESWGIALTGDSAVSGGTVAATGGQALNSIGLRTGSGHLVLSGGGSLTASGATHAAAQTQYSYGILCRNNISITVTDNATLTAIGGDAIQVSVGLHCPTQDSTVTAPGGSLVLQCGSAQYAAALLLVKDMETIDRWDIQGLAVTPHGGGTHTLTVHEDVELFNFPPLAQGLEGSPFPVGRNRLAQLIVRPGRTVTIPGQVTITLPDLADLTLMPATDGGTAADPSDDLAAGRLVNNGTLVFTAADGVEDVPAALAALQMTGSGLVQVGDALYASDGGVVSNVATPEGGKLTLGESDQTVNADGADNTVCEYTVVDGTKTLTIKAGSALMGDVEIPADFSGTIVLEEGARLMGDLILPASTVAGQERQITFRAAAGSIIAGDITATGETIDGSGTVLTIPDGESLTVQGRIILFYGFDITGRVVSPSTLEVEEGAALTVGYLGWTGESAVVAWAVQVDGTMRISSSGASLSAHDLTIGETGVVEVGCLTGAVVWNLTMVKGSEFVSTASETAIYIRNKLELPNYYIPAGYAVAAVIDGDGVTIAPADGVVNYLGVGGIVRTTGAAGEITLRDYTPPYAFSDTTYRVTREMTTDGNGILAVNMTEAPAGAEVTITATPNEGYVVDTVSVSDANGNPLTVTRNADGTFRFTMPRDEVIISATFRPEGTLPFADVAAERWYAAAVQWVYDRGLMVGMDAAAFAPGDPVTRAQVWTVLARMNGVALTDETPWYASARAWAVESGISDGSDPTGAVTREQLVTMLYRNAGSPTPPNLVLDFPDAHELADYARDAMGWAVDCGLITGMEDGLLAPKAGATRGQLAALLQRLDEGED